MKYTKTKLVLCLAFSFITTMCMGGQRISISGNDSTKSNGHVSPKKNPTVKAKTISPKIKFDKVLHDFGSVGQNVSVSCEFKFKNVGNDTLKFRESPKASCGCTVVKLDKMEYAPGESGVINVKYRSSSRPGQVTKNITVYSNDPKVPYLILTIKAKIELAIEINHEKLELSLRKDNGGLVPIVIKAKDDKPFVIKSFTSTNSVISADIDKTKKAIKHIIRPTVNMEKLRKSLRGNININTDHPKTKQLVISYRAKAPIGLSSSQITLLNPIPGKSETREIIISSNYGEKVEIESFKSAKGCMKVVDQEKKDKSVKLILKITPPNRRNNMRFFYDYLTIHTKSGYSVKIAASGFFRRRTNLKNTVRKTN